MVQIIIALLLFSSVAGASVSKACMDAKRHVLATWIEEANEYKFNKLDVFSTIKDFYANADATLFSVCLDQCMEGDENGKCYKACVSEGVICVN